MLLNIKKILKILTFQQKKQLFSLLILMLSSASLELFSISLLIPLVYLLIEPTFIFDYKMISSYLSNLDPKYFFLIGLLIFVLVFFLKSIVLSLLQFLNLKITNNISAELTNRLFKSYLNQDYIFHVKNNTAKLLRNVLSECHHFSDIISLSINILTEILVVSFISIMIFYLEPFGSFFSSLIIIITFFVYYTYFKKRVTKWGYERQINDMNRIKSIQQGLSAIKEIKIYNLENYFAEIQHISNKASLLASLKASFMQYISRPIFEFSAVLTLSIFLLILFVGGKNNINDILPILVFISGSLFRLLPAVSSINIKLHHIKYILPSLYAIYDELVNIKSDDNNVKKISFNFKKQIQLKNIIFSYNPDKPPVLENINLTIAKNEIIGIIGESGAGKSTLIDLMLGLINSTEGHLLIDNINAHDNIKKYQQILAYVPQNIYLIDDTIKNNIIFGSKINNDAEDAKLSEVIKKAQLTKFINKQQKGLETEVGERGIKISGGEKQRIAIARALYKNPQILFFDEATSSLDNETELKLINSIKVLKGHLTIIMVAHRTSSLSICDKIYKISNKKIYNVI